MYVKDSPARSAILLPILTLAVLGGIIGALKVSIAVGSTPNCSLAVEQAEARAAADPASNVDFYVGRMLNMCRHADHWTKTFAKHPDVLGMTRATGDEDLEIACSVFPDTTVREGRR